MEKREEGGTYTGISLIDNDENRSWMQLPEMFETMQSVDHCLYRQQLMYSRNEHGLILGPHLPPASLCNLIKH